MAPPPEYDKEPKAPDKNATTTSNEDSKFSNSINDHQTKLDHKTTNTVANSEVELSLGMRARYPPRVLTCCSSHSMFAYAGKNSRRDGAPWAPLGVQGAPSLLLFFPAYANIEWDEQQLSLGMRARYPPRVLTCCSSHSMFAYAGKNSRRDGAPWAPLGVQGAPSLLLFFPAYANIEWDEQQKSKPDNSVENLDDGRLRALLDEAITYKCPKDREGKSDLFKNLLEEAEQDDQASEAAARCSGGRVRRGAGRRALAHSNSLQDLVAAALAAEPAPRRLRPHAPVSARATHGGSLPSGVDTSFLLGEEPTRGGYLATVRCVNPPPLAERRVSASDANCPAEVELLHRRSKPVFPMTYTARATLEIGSGSVSSGRAVTTTTASNQVRTFRQPRPTFGPPERIYAGHSALYDPSKHQDAKQTKLMNALLCSRNKNVSEPFKGDLRGPRSVNENSGSPWSEIIARYSPATNIAIQIKPPPEDTATTSATRSTELFPGNKITTRNTCTDLSLDKNLVMPTCANPSTHNKLKDTPQTTKTNAKKTNEPSCLISSSYDKTHPTTRFKLSLENKKSSSTAHIAPSLVNKKATLSARNSSLSETKQTKFISQTALTQENQTTSHACETKPSPNNRRMVPHYPQTDRKPDVWMDGVSKWYEDLSAFEPILKNMNENILPKQSDLYSNRNQSVESDYQHDKIQDTSKTYNKQDSRPRNPYNTNMHHSASNISVYGTHREKKIGKSFSNTITNCEDVEYEDYKTYASGDEQHSKPSENISVMEESDIRLRKIYRKHVGHSLAVPSLSSINPRNIRPMSIGTISAPVNETPESPKNKYKVKSLDTKIFKNDLGVKMVTKVNKKSEFMKTEKCDTPQESPASEALHSLSNSYDRPKIVEMIDVPSYEFCTHIEQICKINDCNLQQQSDNKLNKAIYNPSSNKENIQDIELLEIVIRDKEDKSEPVNISQELQEVGNEDDSKELELKDITSNCAHDGIKTSFEQYYCEQQNFLKMLKETTEDTVTNNYDISQNGIESLTKKDLNFKTINTPESSMTPSKISAEDTTSSNIVIKLNKKPEDKVPSDQYILAELPNNAYVFLTMPERLFTPVHNTDKSVKIQEIPNDDSANVEAKSNNVAPKNTKKKKDKAVGLDDAKKKENLNKTALKVLLFENLKRDSNKAEASSEANKEGDSAIPFSCITTPEVVSSCNTTSSTSQSAVAVDPKPRSVISSSFNGLTLSRPNYGATAAAADEYKKSLDENGNAVQGFSSPISGSSQHKKPRRKKSSKNETVIKSHQIDGYQGNKDLNEVLRFIESNAEHGRGAKLGRAKHKDDADDKAGKKRSSDRRKDKESKLKRASSLEERSRTKLEDLTDAPPPRRHERKPRPDTKAERRSWGDDARDAFYYPEPEPAPAPATAPSHPEPELDREPEPEPAPERDPEPAPAPAPPPAPPDTAVELTDFQTVTKRRKPRRRTDDAEREPPRRPRPPSPRPRRESAPPSDRSNDSNDDLDSVHSLPPPPPPPPAPHASYADIARTRHNIPDLIESCNFYAEGESAAGRRAADAPAAAGDADGYPALGGAARLARGKAPPRRERKERAAAAAGGECPAPDVVGDRRPAVILLDSAARPRDMDGVTFGFDINEQLLGAGGRRPRCDLVRDAPDALPVRAGLRALRYRPPDPPPDTNHLHQIIDYVASAWEDVIRCGGGKVRYFSD